MSKNYHEDQHHTALTAIAPGEYDHCTFANCQLGNADLAGRIFSDCTFTDCDLTNAKLHETALKTVTFGGCKLLGLHFEDCRDFLFNAIFSGCILELATFRDWKLKETVFRHCQLLETDFTGADLQNASFDGCDLSRAIFERTDLRGTDFREAINYRFSPEDNRLRGAKFSVEGLPGLLAEYGIVVG
jgi:uncharacterized protein YjbI with pentapeptide repeats